MPELAIVRAFFAKRSTRPLPTEAPAAMAKDIEAALAT